MSEVKEIGKNIIFTVILSQSIQIVAGIHPTEILLWLINFGQENTITVKKKAKEFYCGTYVGAMMALFSVVIQTCSPTCVIIIIMSCI